ncbi:hypothetical protein MMC25_008244 [Agyrium rufum]|nr:hypothetical protein [Agyrium rufum]
MTTITGTKVGPMGFGLMGFTWRESATDFDAAIATMKAALDAGANYWNGGEFYGPPDKNSMHLLNAYFTKYPEDADKVVINIKGGMKAGQLVPDGSEENMRRSVGECLRLLDGKKKLDVFECARVDPNTPIETTIEALGKLVKEGKIGGISLSEVNANTIRRAAKVHPIVSVEIELSLWHTDPLTNGITAACAENNIPIVAYSPLGHGILTGQVRSFDDLPEGDHRRQGPRFQPEVFDKNFELVRKLEEIAKTKGCTPGQLALSWVMSFSGKEGMPVIIPIPGTTSTKRLEENMGALKAALSEKELAKVTKVVTESSLEGTRYPEYIMHLCDL